MFAQKQEKEQVEGQVSSQLMRRVIGKALVLDEIINYIQSLQDQIEFLSMKFEAVNSGLNHTTKGFPLKYLPMPISNPNQTLNVSKTSREYDQDVQLEWPHMAWNSLGGETGKEPLLL